MRIHGFNKTTLLDYPKHLAATIFLGNCNFRCPFCHNASLVLDPSSQPSMSTEEILESLNKRKGILEGVCITGGEPTLHPDLGDFIKDIKSLSLKVKLDTNGTNPVLIESLLSKQLLDYIAMDIKNSKEHYSISIGIPDYDITKICDSVKLIQNSSIDYEFRTTVVKQHHTAEDFVQIGKWLEGSKAYFLQCYKESSDMISTGLSAYTKEELQHFLELLRPYIETIALRGID